MQINKTRCENGDITTDTGEMQKLEKPVFHYNGKHKRNGKCSW